MEKTGLRREDGGLRGGKEARVYRLEVVYEAFRIKNTKSTMRKDANEKQDV